MAVRPGVAYAIAGAVAVLALGGGLAIALTPADDPGDVQVVPAITISPGPEDSATPTTDQRPEQPVPVVPAPPEGVDDDDDDDDDDDFDDDDFDDDDDDD